jgi:putative ABC transport system substrate-binding protein
MSYGENIKDRFSSARRLCRPHPQGRETCRLASGEATKFELVINIETARILGLTVPSSLLAIVDEVIE